MTQDSPTVGYFVGCGPHVDRARLSEAETLVAARVGLVDDFAEDGEIARSYVEETWGDTANVLATMEGVPDLPMVDGVSETRFDEFLAELKGAEERLRDYVALAVDEGESDEVGSREYVDFRNRENGAGAT